MKACIVLTLLFVSSHGFLFGPGGLGGLFGAPAGGCDPCAAARAAPYYPPQPVYQGPTYQPSAYAAPRPVYPQPAQAYQTAPVNHYQPQPAPVQYQSVVEPQPEPVQQMSGGYVQPPPPPPPPAAYATGAGAASSGYKKF